MSCPSGVRRNSRLGVRLYTPWGYMSRSGQWDRAGAPPQWQQPSLCAGWSVKDVIAHVVTYGDLNVVGLALSTSAGSFTPTT
jgi:hypothetical protein